MSEIDKGLKDPGKSDYRTNRMLAAEAFAHQFCGTPEINRKLTQKIQKYVPKWRKIWQFLKEIFGA